MSLMVEARSVSRLYQRGRHQVAAVAEVSLEVEPGTMLAIKGRSGSGKTTLLNLLGGLDRPSEGSVSIDGVELTEQTDDQLGDLRLAKVGFVFQSFGLIPVLTARENVEMPLRLADSAIDLREERSVALLEMVGLGKRAQHRPHELSGGEQQRVAIARALANQPKILLADEPTGQLDSRTGQGIIELIHTLVRAEQLAVIVATHDPSHLALADRVVELSDGRIVSRD